MPSRAWTPNREDLAAREAELRTGLVGQELQAVRYVGLDYRLPTADGRRFHSIDYGIELDLAAGLRSIAWDQKGSNEGLSVAPGPVPLSPTPSDDLTNWDFTRIWRERLPDGVQAIDTVWTRHTWTVVSSGPEADARVGDTETSDYCLTTLVLGAARDVLVITLGGGDGPEFSRAQFDEVAVFFSLQDARAAGALLPGDADAVTPS